MAWNRGLGKKSFEGRWSHHREEKEIRTEEGILACLQNRIDRERKEPP